MGATAGIAGAVGQAYGAWSKSQATKTALKAQAAVDEQNAQIAEWQAHDALDRGATSERQVRQRTAQLKSTQRARFAANGVALDSESVLDVLSSTDVMGEQDVATVRSNAEHEAWAYRIGVSNNNANAAILHARAGAESPGLSAMSTLLTRASQVNDSWLKWKKASSGSLGGGD